MQALAWGSTWALHGHTLGGGWAAARGLAGRAGGGRGGEGEEPGGATYHIVVLCVFWRFRKGADDTHGCF